MNNIIELSERAFGAEVLQSSLPVVVDFYASWCGPCKMLAPLLEQFAAEFQGRIKFAKVDVDHAFNLATQYEITGVPTLALFRQGRVVDSVVGLVSPRSLKAWLEQHSAPASAPAPASAL